MRLEEGCAFLNGSRLATHVTQLGGGPERVHQARRVGEIAAEREREVHLLKRLIRESEERERPCEMRTRAHGGIMRAIKMRLASMSLTHVDRQAGFDMPTRPDQVAFDHDG